MSENEINRFAGMLPKADDTMPVHDEPGDQVDGKKLITFGKVSVPDIFGAQTVVDGHSFAFVVTADACDAPCHRMFVARLYMDGEEVAELHTTYGKERTRRMARGAMLKLIGHVGKRGRARALRERMG